MAQLSAADIDRWRPEEIASVFGISTNIADHSVSTSTQLQQLSVFDTWDSHAADAAHEAVHRTRADLDRHGEVANKIANAARAAEGAVIEVKSRLAALRIVITEAGFILDASNDNITDPHPPAHLSPHDLGDCKHTLDGLVAQLAQVLAAAARADDELAFAIRIADGVCSVDKSDNGSKVNHPNDAAGLVETFYSGATQGHGQGLQDRFDPPGRHAHVPAETGDAELLARGGKAIARVGVVSDAAIAGYDAYNDYRAGDASAGEAIGEGVGAFGGGWAGGAAAGAVAGSFAGPVGTIVGVGVGALAGSVVGKSLGKWAGGLF